jgi:drug/metabolite transporter (DMT)-like permease
MLSVAAMWGGTFIAARLISRSVEPFLAATLRFTIASLVLLWILHREEGGFRALSRAQWLRLFVLGVFGVFGYNALFLIGTRYVEAARAALIVTINPAFIAIAAAIFLGEKLSLRRALGVSLCILGAMTAITRGNPFLLFTQGFSWPEFLLLLCPVCWTVYTIVGRPMLEQLTPLAVTSWSHFTGFLLSLPTALTMDGSIAVIPLEAWTSLLFLAVFGSALAFVWFYRSVKLIGTARTATFISFSPLFAMVWGRLLLGEPISPSIAAAAALVTGGVLLTNWPATTTAKR